MTDRTPTFHQHGLWFYAVASILKKQQHYSLTPCGVKVYGLSDFDKIQIGSNC